MSTNPKYYALQIKGMSLAELIKERNSLMDDIREIEEGICDDDIFVLDSQTAYQYNHLYLMKVCKRISEMSFQDDFEDVLKIQFQIAIVDYTMEDAFYYCRLLLLIFQ